jgi:hypothetical protein
MIVLAGDGYSPDAQASSKIEADRGHAEPTGRGGCRDGQQEAGED